MSDFKPPVTVQKKKDFFQRFGPVLVIAAVIAIAAAALLLSQDEEEPRRTTRRSTPTQQVEAPTEAATEAATEAVTEAPTEVATETATEAATEVATETATETATEAATETATEAATEIATEAATEGAVAGGEATEAATETATEIATEAPTEAATEAATESPTEAPTEAATAVEAPTEAATEAATESPTEAATEIATEVATEAPTEAATEAATTAPTEAATEVATEAATEAPAPTETVQVTMFVPYIPNVQFAPLYVADAKGYFAEEGIDFEIEYSFNESDGVDRVAINELQFAIFSGEQVPLARAQGKPLVYVMEWYHRFPVGVVVPADSTIQGPEDLAGVTLGTPTLGGASYVGLRALLNTVGLTEEDLRLEIISFTVPEQLCEGLIDAGTVYVVNEPLTITQQCFEVRVIEIAEYITLVSNGLVTNEETIENDPDLVRRMIRAIRRGIEDTIANPDEAFELSLPYITDLPEDQRPTQRQVLLNAIPLWEAENIGETNPEAWEATQQVLLDMNLLREPLDDLTQAYTNEFLPE
jgi:NitT/TauT family transport system substrate-binding protein